MLLNAVGGFIFSGIYIAVPGSPWVTGQTADILGHVKEQNGTAIPNATVSCADMDVLTNETGWFHISGVAAGRQAIVVDAAGFRQLRWMALINGGNTFAYSFVLTRGNGTETHDDVSSSKNLFYFCGSLLVLVTAITLLGALSAFQRKRYALATIGAMISFSVGLFQGVSLGGIDLPIGIIFSLVSVILLLFSRGEFT